MRSGEIIAGGSAAKPTGPMSSLIDALHIAAGERRAFRGGVRSNRVGLILEVPDMDAFQEMLQSPAGADAMKFDGVRPETIVIFDKASDHV